MLPICGFVAGKTAWNVITHEKPSQPLIVRKYQGNFWLEESREACDGLLGGFAWFDLGEVELLSLSTVVIFMWEHRIATVMADDGVFDVAAAAVNVIDNEVRSEIKVKGFEV